MRFRQGRRSGGRHSRPPCFAAIDLGTNNCRLLIATPSGQSFRVVDAYSRIVRLGAGVERTRNLSQAAMDRTVEALKICAEKMADRHVIASRCIATQACRAAENGPAFLERIREETGLELVVVTPEIEAGLSVKGCQDLIGPDAKAVLVFDIGGGSTELSWLKVYREGERIWTETRAWTSLRSGVVTMAERHGDKDMTREAFDTMAADVADQLASVNVPEDIQQIFDAGEAHLIGTSGTVTSLAGVHLKLKRYSRRDVDGLWLSAEDAENVSEHLRQMGYEKRAQEPCIGQERADLVVPGCALLKGIMAAWPTAQIRVGDRGLREGLLIDMINEWRKKKSA